MSTYGTFKRNENLEQSGVSVDMGSAGKFKVARAGGSNKRYEAALERAMRPHRKQFQLGTLSNEVANKMLLDAFVEAVFLGWEGVTNADGKEMPFTKDNVRRLMTDLPDLFAALRDIAQDANVFKTDVDREADKGN